MRYPLAALLLLAGCAYGPTCRAMRYQDYNILVCKDDSVDRHCHKYATRWDDGTPMDGRRIRGCYRGPASPGRRGNIIVGESYLNALPHEICHAEGKYSPKDCEGKYPVVGE